ncbi:hypothetical protein EQG49_03505 [Periweissella cryptocerci]|uniref:Uncharacterized protein n=1 Tax=Periweissella cryptocerci TaxID=2506420 RepID=A0A4P6YSB9_9LACO|nr:hypothetical protein [Periweissella cryptocerci]QBO35588.1 hypothetical protein EQG49_03505 [Periweissella cryptocerci]
MTELMTQATATQLRVTTDAPMFGREYSQQVETQVAYFANQVSMTFVALNDFGDHQAAIQDVLAHFITDQYAIFWREPNDWSDTTVRFVAARLVDNSAFAAGDGKVQLLAFVRFLVGDHIQLGINPVEMQLIVNEL